MPATLSEEEFDQEATAFLKEHLQPRMAGNAGWGQGSDDVSVLPERTPEEDLADLKAAQGWLRTRFDAGFGWLSGPEKYGGRGLPRSFEGRYSTLEAGFTVPTLSQFIVGLGMVAPTILAHGTEEVKEAYLRGMYRGDIVGCQLFSEPGAGSDLAGLQTRAVRDGDEWIVNGQKVWTSHAQLAEIGELVCRTNPDVPKHQGLTAFVVNIHTPGVEVRPLRQMTGGATFNEVFFTDVRIPDSHRLGDVDRGWTVALTTLMNERAAVGGAAGGPRRSVNVSRLVDLIRHLGRADDPLVRQQLADIYINATVGDYTNERAMASVAAGGLPGPELSIAKLALTMNMRRTCDLVSTVLGPRLVADTGEWGTYAWAKFVLGVCGLRVAGGTDEILRNIIGERVLGLPKEPAAAS
jgi:acyl-CoA dehydrogenase